MYASVYRMCPKVYTHRGWISLKFIPESRWKNFLCPYSYASSQTNTTSYRTRFTYTAAAAPSPARSRQRKTLNLFILNPSTHSETHVHISLWSFHWMQHTHTCTRYIKNRIISNIKTAFKKSLNLYLYIWT